MVFLNPGYYIYIVAMNPLIINRLDQLSTLLGLVTIPLNTYQKVAVWPLYLLANAINLVLYLEKGLYTRIFALLLIVPLNIYGWVRWAKDQNLERKKKAITRLNLKEWGLLFCLGMLCWGCVFFLLKKFRGWGVPLPGQERDGIDAWVMTFLFLGTLLTAQKRLSSPLIWLIYNLFSFYQLKISGMQWIHFKYLFYSLISPYTYYIWLGTYRAQKKENQRNH